MIPSSLLSANAIPISRSEKLRLIFFNPNEGNSYQINIRYQIADASGKISDNFDTFLLAASANNLERILNLTDGLLIAVTVNAGSNQLQAGEIFCAVALQYGSVSQSSNLLQLVAGYITGNAPLNYPLTESRDTNQTAPATICDTFPDGGAGSEMNLTLPPLFYTRITGIVFTYHASVDVAARTVTIRINNTFGAFIDLNLNATVTDSVNWLCYSFEGTLPTTIPTNTRYLPLPKLPYLRGVNIESITTNIQANDEYRNIRVYSEKYVAT